MNTLDTLEEYLNGRMRGAGKTVYVGGLRDKLMHARRMRETHSMYPRMRMRSYQHEMFESMMRQCIVFDESGFLPVKNSELQQSDELASMTYKQVVYSGYAYGTPHGWLLGSWKHAQFMRDLQLIPLNRVAGQPETSYFNYIYYEKFSDLMTAFPAFTYARYKILEYIKRTQQALTIDTVSETGLNATT